MGRARARRGWRTFMGPCVRHRKFGVAMRSTWGRRWCRYLVHYLQFRRAEFQLLVVRHLPAKDPVVRALARRTDV
eukprot:7070282-Alexandrium_andersonii.AAC.1